MYNRHPEQNIHECGFPGAVLSEQRMYLTGPDVKTYIFEYLIARIRLGYVSKLQ
jgi:hypothetical protein